MPTLPELLEMVVTSGASDLHLASGRPPILRLNGGLKPVQREVLAPDTVAGYIRSLLSPEQQAAFARDHEFDFAFAHRDLARFRANLFVTAAGPAMALRLIPARVPTLDELGAPPVLKSLAGQHKGLLLVTGPTGSGKSTTPVAMINHINERADKHILTIEDPIEYMHESRRSLVNQREVGHHTASFARALRSALREDPDVILVGEMRDLETISLALTAAETGHLVLGTLHTTSAAKTVDRIIDVFPTGDKEMVRAALATSLQAVIAQTLLRRPAGGRVAAFEIMIATSAIRNLIREAKVPQIESMIQLGTKLGMQTMRDAVQALVAQQQVSPAEAEAYLAGLDAESSARGDETAGGGTRPPEPPARTRPAKGYSF